MTTETTDTTEPNIGLTLYVGSHISDRSWCRSKIGPQSVATWLATGRLPSGFEPRPTEPSQWGLWTPAAGYGWFITDEGPRGDLEEYWGHISLLPLR